MTKKQKNRKSGRGENTFLHHCSAVRDNNKLVLRITPHPVTVIHLVLPWTIQDLHLILLSLPFFTTTIHTLLVLPWPGYCPDQPFTLAAPPCSLIADFGIKIVLTYTMKQCWHIFKLNYSSDRNIWQKNDKCSCFKGFHDFLGKYSRIKSKQPRKTVILFLSVFMLFVCINTIININRSYFFPLFEHF